MTVLSFFATAGATYAYWNVLEATQNSTINVGRGVAINVEATANPPAGMKLVPTGQVVDSKVQVDFVELEYDVKLVGSEVSGLGLTVKVSNIKIGDSVDHAALVGINITMPTANTLGNDEIKVIVRVTLAEPTDQTTYNAIINKPITFTLTFTAVAV